MLNDLPRAEVRQRSDELLELFGLTERRDTPVMRLSGGMRRALDIARGLIHRPQILFLDEPTIGLDVPNRRAIWRHIARLRASLGITVFLTTHYLEEAVDCDEVSFLNAGRIVLSGRPRTLIEQLGKYIVEIETDQPERLAEQLETRFGDALIEDDRVHFRAQDEHGDPGALQAELANSVRAVRWRRPNLNDVFLWVNRPARTLRKVA
jgi:ABC-2 type transport system ATP-binding protein